MKYIGPLAWAYVIIIGGLMITPEGINPIVRDALLRTVLGVVAIAIGGMAFIASRSAATARL